VRDEPAITHIGGENDLFWVIVSNICKPVRLLERARSDDDTSRAVVQ